MKKILHNSLLVCLFVFQTAVSQTQQLGMKEALQQSLTNYGSIKAKTNYAEASKANAQLAKLDYLPNLVLSAQQDYGTINGQNGPLYGFGGFGVASSGLPLASQNWNAAFGALYLANFNWEVFSFGRSLERMKVAKAASVRDEKDLEQERFQHQVKVAAAYLNLLAAQRITFSLQKNLDRALVFKNNSVTRATNGLAAGVDSSLAKAEVSNAKINLNRAKDQELQLASQLAVLMGVSQTEFALDTTFLSRLPQALLDPATIKENEHPLISFYKSRMDVSLEQTKLFRRQYLPSVSVFGIFQERGSGFQSTYTYDQTAYTHNYSSGVTPTRANYLLGIGLNWNLTGIVRNTQQVKSQQYISAGLQNEHDLVKQQVQAQNQLAENKMRLAVANYYEAPAQVNAAMDAYIQKSALYKNGLATQVDVTQALYALNRAETDRDVALTNVWQALLLKAAASGDLNLFTKEF